jgi:plastocyanin
VRSLERWTIVGCWLLLAGLCVPPSHGQGVDVSVKILAHASPSAGRKHTELPSVANVVLWLSSVEPTARIPTIPARQISYKLVQKNKMFTPHLLVVPTGSQVEFPNQDPFFHNVFSLFNGKRFDLGLYESGTTRSVRFDREGASYIFCNIHPEMGAIVLALSTPYYAISGANGVVILHNVPPGSYRLNLWSENGQPANPDLAQSIMRVSTEPVHLGDITLQPKTDPLANHKNKFGEDYQPTPNPKY